MKKRIKKGIEKQDGSYCVTVIPETNILGEMPAARVFRCTKIADDVPGLPTLGRT